jgi:hypothetical protein
MTIFHNAQLILNTSNISQERLDGEVVVISFNTGKYFSAKGSAADLFWLIENGIDQSLWTEILSQHFEGFSVENSGIAEFLTVGVSEELFIPLDAPALEAISLPVDYTRGTWEIPKLVVFEDLQDLLLLDPIHDTSLEGWPTAKNE